MAFESLWVSAKLDFEILNIPISNIANSMGLTEAMVQQEAKAKNWRQWFPIDEDKENEFQLDEDADLHEGDNVFELRANNFTSEGRKRLQVYQVAKQMHLMGQYTRLEASLIEKANEAINLVDPEHVGDIQTLSGVLQSLTKDLNQLQQSLTLGTDADSGLPQLIIRDLSNSNA